MKPAKKASPAGTALAIIGGLVILFALGGGLAALQANSSPRHAAGAPASAPATGALEGLPGTPALAPELPASATFEAHSHVSGYQSSFYVLGFVKNTSPFSIDKPKVTAVLLDKSGKEVATRDGYAEGEALASQASAPVKVLVSDPPAHDHIAFEVVARKASYIPESAPGLRLEILEAPHSTGGGSWEVTGKVFNDGARGARFVNVLVPAFDASSHLIGLDSTYADGESIAAGASGRFRAMPLYDAPPHHFKYAVSGQPLK
jgi:hypothetical protein